MSDLDPPDGRDSRRAALDRYWKRNLGIMTGLLAVWALVGLGAGILFADWLNQFNLPGTGFPLGFWFAQQGSIIVFVLIVLLYAILMNRADRRHHAERRELAGKKGSAGSGEEAP